MSGFFLCEALLAAVQNLSAGHLVGLVSLREVKVSRFDLLSVFSELRFSVGKCSLCAFDGIGFRHWLCSFWKSSFGLRKPNAAEQLGFNFEASRVNKNNHNICGQTANGQPQNQLPSPSANHRANRCGDLGGLPDCWAKRSARAGGYGQARQTGNFRTTCDVFSTERRGRSIASIACHFGIANGSSGRRGCRSNKRCR